MCDGVLSLSETTNSEISIKFKFLQISQKSPLALSLTVPTDQNIRIHFRHTMIYLADNNSVIQQIPIRSITKYVEDDGKFIFSVRNQVQNKVVCT